jgi:hypothetical protein
MKELWHKLGMNPTEDVLGVTLYSTRYADRTGVGLFYVKNLDREKVLGLLKDKHPNVQTSQYGDRSLYTWAAGGHGKKKQGQKIKLTGAFARDSLVVIGTDAEGVKAALDVLDGKKPGLAKDAALLQGIPESALIAARGLDIPEEFGKTTTCPVVHNLKAATVVWTENQGEIAAKYEFTTTSEAVAKNFKAVVDGLKALAQLRHGDVPAIMKVVDGLTAEAQGDTFTASLKVSTEELEAAINAMIEQKKHRPWYEK